MSESTFINENKVSPPDAMKVNLDAGAGQMTIEHNNGCMEVRNGGGIILMQTTNIPEGSHRKLWELLESFGDIQFRMK